MKYKIMYWLFFGGADVIYESNLTKEEAEKRCFELNEENLDSMYSGFYIKEQGDLEDEL